MKVRPFATASLLVLTTAFTTSVPAQDQKAPAPEANGGPQQEYSIGAEDVLQVSVWKNDALSRTVSVRPDGKISLPLLNDVQAAGLTPMQLRDVLIGKLVEYIPSPEVSVLVSESRSFKVSVIGEVPKPGRFELRSWTTVLDVIAMAGGFNQFSSRGRIVVLRYEAKNVTRIAFNYNKAVAAGGEQENFYLRPGDIVIVP